MHKNFFKVVFMRDPTTCRIVLKEEKMKSIRLKGAAFKI